MFKSHIKKMNQNINTTTKNIVTEDAKKNLKNGYLAVAVTFIMTLVGFNLSNQIFTGETLLHSGGGLFLFIIATFALIFGIHTCRNNIFGLVMLLTFGFMEGVLIAPMIEASSSQAIFGALLGTVVLAVGTSIVAVKGYENNSLDTFNWGGYLLITLIGLIVTMIINIFVQATVFQILISSGVIVVMSAFMIYDTQQAIKYPRESYLLVALSFYLNLLNIFIHMLAIFGMNSDD